MQLAIDVRGQQKLFKYDRVFGNGASQAEVYEDTKPLVRSVLDGEPRMIGFSHVIYVACVPTATPFRQLSSSNCCRS